MEHVQIGFWVIAGLVVIALLFDFMNGFHDAANSIATVVSTGVLRPTQAVLFAAFFNFVAIFIFHLSVAATVGKGIVQPGVRRMRPASVSTTIQRQSTRASFSPVSLVMVVSRFIVPFLNASQAVVRLIFSARPGIRQTLRACLPTRNALWRSLKKAWSMP